MEIPYRKVRKQKISSDDLKGVFPVPPLARNEDTGRTLNFEANGRIADHILAGGCTRLLYGGNAFLYHATLSEYEQMLDWLRSLANDIWVIPSVGPSYGRAIDQASMVRQRGFPCVMVLPCSDPRDAGGLERGLREIAEASGCPLMLYLKEEHNFGSDKAAGLDVVARLVSDGICVAIKYAVVRQDPALDAYLSALLNRVDRKYVISGIGERPAIVHMRDWSLPGFTTGSGCVAPAASQEIFEACTAGDYERAASLRAQFLELEDIRDAWGPARVLHAAVDLAGIAATGPIPPYVSELTQVQKQEVAPVAKALAVAGSKAIPAVEVR
jgi:dihydrodipicolinate synthase/N-acetylneuraminate lyase